MPLIRHYVPMVEGQCLQYITLTLALSQSDLPNQPFRRLRLVHKCASTIVVSPLAYDSNNDSLVRSMMLYSPYCLVSFPSVL